MKRKNITIGLFGFGCVGSGLYEVLDKTPGLKTKIKKICVKDQRKSRSIDAGLFTYDRDDILNDPDINIIVELIDDADAAFEIVSTAMKNGKGVVTANKKMVAEHFDELLQLQILHQVPLLYEAACCASIPIIRNLEEYYDNDLLESIEGIVNGSTNYILTKTFAENMSYPDALKQAQEKGYAESDPSLDTGGHDAKYKLLILLAHAFGIVSKPSGIFNLGIERLGDLEFNYAREKNLKIKLVAQAYKSGEGKVSCLVMPKFIDPENKLFWVDDVYNGVNTKTSFADQQFFQGKGAGAYPTASAVLSDISALSYDYRYEYKKLNQERSATLKEDLPLKVLLSYPISGKEKFNSQFDSITEIYSNQDSGFIIGILPLSSIKNITVENPETSFVLFG
jgi:homoserine dehydrogenase